MTNEKTPDSAASALSAGLGMTVADARENAGDALRYRWLVQYLIGPRTDLDDAIVAAKTKGEHDAILDADMMATNCLPNVRHEGRHRRRKGTYEH
jgi:hypothetical protein